MNRWLIRSTSVLSTAMLTLIGLTGVGHAAASAKPFRTCVQRVTETAATCFADHRAAIAYATAGRITDAPLDPRAALDDAVFLSTMAVLDRSNRTDAEQHASIDAGIPIAYEFVDINYSGAQPPLMITADYGCDDDGWWTADWYIPSIDPRYNDVVSSFYGTNNCDQRSWEHPNYGGRMLDLRPADSTLVNDGFNDVMSSMQFT